MGDSERTSLGDALFIGAIVGAGAIINGYNSIKYSATTQTLVHGALLGLGEAPADTISEIGNRTTEGCIDLMQL